MDTTKKFLQQLTSNKTSTADGPQTFSLVESSL